MAARSAIGIRDALPWDVSDFLVLLSVTGGFTVLVAGAVWMIGAVTGGSDDSTRS
jgi:hypothetical protein